MTHNDVWKISFSLTVVIQPLKVNLVCNHVVGFFLNLRLRLYTVKFMLDISVIVVIHHFAGLTGCQE